MHLNVCTRGLLNCLDRLANTRARTAPDVQGGEPVAPFSGNLFGRGNVRCGNVGNVNIVTNGGAIRCGVVAPIQLKRHPSLGCVHEAWQQVRLWVMALRNLLRCTRHIEVAQRDRSEFMRCGVRAEHLLESGLRCPIRVDRCKRELLMEHVR